MENLKEIVNQLIDVNKKLAEQNELLKKEIEELKNEQSTIIHYYPRFDNPPVWTPVVPNPIITCGDKLPGYTFVSTSSSTGRFVSPFGDGKN
jgi:hypothetical protein